MTGYLNEVSWHDTKDPYAKRYCNESCTDSESKVCTDCYTGRSRDPTRTPMQVRILNFDTLISS